MMIKNIYKEISKDFSVESPIMPFSSPELILFNEDLFERLKLNWSMDEVLGYLSGKTLIANIPPTALAYSGHQFGHFNPTLGDGRAHYLGSIIKEYSYDIQLKGSGATPFSRGGDGLCALGPAVREFIMSQALKSLGVKTTECLAVVKTGNDVYRQGYIPGAVVCRVAESHIRVGSFQYLALQQDKEAMNRLLDLAITRHFPTIQSTGDQRVVEFLTNVCQGQIELITEWLRVGFIHGVMNTDNCLVSGETIDFGPCAMLEVFDFSTVYSSIDQHGRYAFGQQPTIAHWNCARLAESLLLIMDCDEQQGINTLSDVLKAFSDDFNVAYHTMWSKKLGIPDWQDSDSELLSKLLEIMKKHHLDYTNTFAALTSSLMPNQAKPFNLPEQLNTWFEQWFKRISEYDQNGILQKMRCANPAIIPRNGLVEQVIEEFYELGRSPLLETWLPLLSSPYEYKAYDEKFTSLNAKSETYQTFCGT